MIKQQNKDQANRNGGTKKTRDKLELEIWRRDLYERANRSCTCSYLEVQQRVLSGPGWSHRSRAASTALGSTSYTGHSLHSAHHRLSRRTPTDDWLPAARPTRRLADSTSNPPGISILLFTLFLPPHSSAFYAGAAPRRGPRLPYPTRAIQLGPTMLPGSDGNWY